MIVILYLVATFIIFRFFVRRDYLKKGKLTLFSTVLEWAIFFGWGFFTYFDLLAGRFDQIKSPIIVVISWIFIIVGLSFLFVGIIKLGFRRSNGLQVNNLHQSGLYNLTRNPQVVACTFAVLGYALLYFSWHTLGWVIIYLVAIHTMVITEEEHLLDKFGNSYEDYCRRAPRYLGHSRKK